MFEVTPTQTVRDVFEINAFGVMAMTPAVLPTGHRLLADSSSVEFVPDSPGSSVGHLLFVREGNLVAQSFDATSPKLSGQPFVVAEQVDFTSTRRKSRRRPARSEPSRFW